MLAKFLDETFGDIPKAAEQDSTDASSGRVKG